MTWRVVLVNREAEELGLVWSPAGAPVAEWYWLAQYENPDDAANVMPPEAIAELIRLVGGPA